MQVEMENLKQDRATQRELDRIQAMSNVGSDVLIATADAANAALLADLKKSEVGSEDRAKLDEERLRLYEKLNETERAKADAIAEAYKTALQTQQSSVQQMIGGLAQASRPQMGMPGTPPPLGTSELWYVSLNGLQVTLQGAQIYQYIQSGQITSTTMVWKAGMTAWMPASQVPELASYLPPGPPGPSPPSSAQSP